VTDTNYMKIWDLHLARASEEPISDTARLRTMVYLVRHVPNQTEVEVRLLGAASLRVLTFPQMPMLVGFGKLDESSVYYTSMTFVPEDQIFPDALEAPATGFVARDVPGGTELKFMFQFRYNAGQTQEDIRAFSSDLVEWYNNFLEAAAQDLGSQPAATTFHLPNRGSMVFEPNRPSMVFDDFHNQSFQSMDLGSNLPKLPSFSSLNLPPLIVAEKAEVARSIDVVVPAGRTLGEYWAGLFGDSETPTLILPSAMDRVEFCNDKLEVLLGVKATPSVLGPRDSLDFTLLESQVANIVNQRIQFFVHFFTFVIG
jgi:hypothetical protein